MAVLPVERLRDEIGRLLHRGLDVRQFSLAAARVLRRAVPCDGVCLVTMDPATALPTGEVVEGGLPAAATARLAEIEVQETDFIKFWALSRSARPVASLHEATGGDLGRSRRHRELKRPHGFGDELRAALVGDARVWGGLTLLRAEGRRPFSPADTRRVAAVAPRLAEGLRRSVVVAAFTDGGRPSGDDQHGQHGQHGHGLLLLADDNTIELADATARMWLDELRTGDGTGERLPPVVNGVASRARAAVAGRGAASVAGARVRTPSGRWLSVRGSVLGEGAEARIAVILEPARSPELAPGLHFLGLLWQHSQASASLVGPQLDGPHLVDRIAAAATA